ncbi:NUDIX hydrolase [Priestia taiwanensis]|uniref:DNA mismatch repair protein MutT n=1 Tax=Priestia taiwanensis TaxID=1347902 RepID=A0A917ANV8_9BACI|nr:NUDIX domain-containing protein [Priestia taiwanensis]MBM7362602.1 isopentenyldiphosphate isomerase [Priestia taiwanensis]GGE63586.1 DNA mismatch repair protein MutT [Priestia taiwanensis]
MSEILSIFNEQGEKVGEKERNAIHRDGDWHETFHCWFVEEAEDDMHLYFQLRSSTKKDFPNVWDITAAGHILCDEEIMIAGLREIEEELGISFQSEDVHYTGIQKIDCAFPPFIDRERCHVYFHTVTQRLTFSPGEEVADVMKMKLSVLEDLLYKRQTSATCISLLSDEELVVEYHQLYPHNLDYYEETIQKVSRMKNIKSL